MGSNEVIQDHFEVILDHFDPILNYGILGIPLSPTSLTHTHTHTRNTESLSPHLKVRGDESVLSTF